MLLKEQQKRLPIVVGLAMALTQWSSAALSQAQDAPGAPIEEVIIYGIKSSLVDAIGIKRDAVGVMDAISAEDFGKFPDGNLAESLARAPGVAIDRSNVEGQKIAVRGFGPEFNLVTLNGRQMPTVKGQYGGGRSFNFGDIASPGVSSLQIFKTSNSTLPSGGIGSTVNMVTTKPLEVEGTKRFVGMSYVNDTTSRANDDPFEAEMLFATNQGRWGFSLSGAYHERTNRETGTRESNWITTEILAQSEGYFRVDSSNPNFNNGNQRADGNTFYREPAAYLIKDNNRIRKNLQATLQFDLTADLRATVDYTNSGVEFESTGMLFGSWLGGWDTQSATINANGAFTDVVVGNRAYDHTATWSKLESDNNSYGFNLAWDVSDSLQLSLDYHSSTAELDGNIFDNELGFTTDNKATVTVTGAGSSGINSFSYDDEFNPSNYMGTYLFLRDGFQENEIEQVQLKGTWTSLATSGLVSVDFGLSSIENNYLNQAREGNFGSQGPAAADYDDSLFERRTLGGSFMDSFNRTIGTPYYYSINPSAALDAFAAVNQGLADAVDGTVCCNYGDLDSNEQVKEQLDSAYIQFNYETTLRDMPLRVVAGLRYETSDTTSISYYPAPTTIRWDMIQGLIGVGGEKADVPRYGSSNELLPTIAASLALTDNQVIRASWGKSIARPNLGDLGAELNIGSKDFFNLTAQGGNPDLGPLLSTNFDISYENYYAEGSYFAIAAFRKEVEDFIGTRTTEDQPIDGLTNPFLSEIGQQAQACVQAWADAGRPQTGFPGEGGTGDCVSQQALWAQGWMNDQQHMGWVALAISRGIDVSNGFPYGACDYDGWWRCEPGYIDGTSSDPQALFDITQPFNMKSGAVNGIELSWQHLFEGTPFGLQMNFTKVSGGDVEPNKNIVGEQFILPGLGDAGNISVFFENPKHTLRLAMNYRGETAQGFANYFQPVYVDERKQFDVSYQYRYSDSFTVFVDAMNITDEETRLYVRNSEMLFLSQDHGPVFKFGIRSNF